MKFVYSFALVFAFVLSEVVTQDFNIPPQQNDVETTKDQCDKGPRHWCSSLKFAINCDAVTYCSLLFWSKKATTVQHIERCDNCVEMLNHATLDDIQSILPLPDNQTEAVKVMLAFRINQQQVCLFLDLCDPEIKTNDLETPDELYSEESSANNDEDCEKCLKLTEKLHDYPQISLQQNNEYSLCRSVVKEEKAACHSFVQEYAEKLVTLLFEHKNPFDMCKDLQLCADKTLDEGQLNEIQMISYEEIFFKTGDDANLEVNNDKVKSELFQIIHNQRDTSAMMEHYDLKSNENPQNFEQLSKHHETRRKVCRIIVHQMVKIIGHDKITKAVVDKAIKYACITAGPLQSICHHLIAEIANEVIDKIKAKEDPMSVCKKI